MNIIPDLVLTVCLMFPFLVLVAGMHLILYKPMLAYLDARAAATVGARKEAEELQARAASRLNEWEVALAKAQAEVADFRAQRRQVAQGQYQRIVAEARAAADTRLADALASLRTEATAARAELDGTARALAGDVAVRVLGRPLPQMEA
ncbi:MAG: ATP synthase F0 subunit B [Myxococcota bacterium]